MLTKIALHSTCFLLVVTMSTMANDREPQALSGATRGSAAERRVADQLALIRQDPPALRAFLRAFPKGADLHSHLTGAVYAESYIRWAAGLPLCIELSTFAFVDAVSGPSGTCKDPIAQRPASQVPQDPVLYRNVIDALSTRRWQEARGPGHYQFFDTFVKFDAVTREGRDASPALMGHAVAEVMHRGALQNVQHLELLLSFDALADVSSVGGRWDSDEHFHRQATT